MAEDQAVVSDVAEQSPQMSEQQQVEQEAINRYKESQKTSEEKADGVPEGYNEDGTPKEELIAGKFKSQEDLLKAYQELESKLGQPKEAEAPKEEASEETKAETASEAAGFNVTAYEKEYAETGSLSEKSYADLEKKGFTKQQVDQYIQGQTAYAESVKSNIYNSVGGQEKYVELINWVSQNMTEDVINDYNAAVDSLDQQKVLRNLEYMKLKYDQQAPQQTRRLEGDATGGGMQPFADKNQWQKAMTDRLYGKDAKYTKMVDQRYLASRKRGIL